MHHTLIDGPWVLRVGEGPAPAELHGVAVDAVVPGCVHTDLVRAGLIPDPFDGDNEAALTWIGRTDWVYETTFDAEGPSAGERIELVADGLDTFATVWVNDRLVGTAANQFRQHRFDLAAAVVSGQNTLRVAFDAPVSRAEVLARVHGNRPHANHHPYNTVRKAASNFGWDWGIDVATSGIWKPIALERWSGVRLAGVRPLVGVDGETGVLDVHADLEGGGSATLDVSVARAGGTVATRTVTATGVSAHVTLRVDDAELWWPIGHGAQPLYDVTVAVRESGETWTGRVGFRTVRIDTEPDAFGSGFTVVVNGRPIFVRGANWIPDHAFVTEIDRDRYRRRIDDAVLANMNLLRVWGGGLYESDDFYDACDERGVLVWQDFLFACAAYAEEDWLRVEVEAEAREAVTRLSPHPSLVLWNGNNENIWGYVDWWWRTELDGKTWGAGYYRKVLPAIVAELDPTRPYSPGSPYSYSDYLHPNDPDHGTVHIWDVWNRRDYADYADWNPRFVSEFGFQGPPAWSTLVDVVHDEPRDPFGPQLLVHQKAEDGNGKLERGLTGHLPTPETFDDWHWATQLNQAMAVRFGIKHFRSLGDRMTGTIVWQLNDNWPVVSWAAVDFAERRKPLWFALRDAYRPRLVVFAPRAGAPEVVLSNDSDEPWTGDVVVRRLAFDGTERARASVAMDVAARSSAAAAVPEQTIARWDRAAEVVVVEAPGFGRTVHSGAEVVDQRLDPDPLEVTVEREQDAVVLTVTARSLVRDVTVLADRAHPSLTVDQGMVTLLAGESAAFRLTRNRAGGAGGGAGEAWPSDDVLRSPLVLRHANGLLSAVTR